MVLKVDRPLGCRGFNSTICGRCRRELVEICPMPDGHDDIPVNDLAGQTEKMAVEEIVRRGSEKGYKNPVYGEKN